MLRGRHVHNNVTSIKDGPIVNDNGSGAVTIAGAVIDTSLQRDLVGVKMIKLGLVDDSRILQRGGERHERCHVRVIHEQLVDHVYWDISSQAIPKT